MPLARPTLSELIARAEQDLASRLGLGQLIPRGPAAALARVVAGASHLLHGRIDYATNQTWPDTADAENLDRFGALLSLPRKAAVAAGGLVVFTGVNGSSIPTGSQVQRADAEKFETVAAGTIVGGAATIEVLGITPGVAGNTAGLAPLTLVSPVSGVDTDAQAEALGLYGGADAEQDEPYRRRLVQRLSQAPGAGTSADYVRWALEVPGVTRAWCLPNNQGPGTVGVTFVLDGDPVSIIPGATKVAEVQTYIDARRPEPASVLVFAPVPVAVAFTIALVPNTPEAQASVAQSLAELFEREGGPNRTIPLSHLREAISLAPLETDHTLTVPAADLVLGGGEIPVVGTLTWV